MASSIAGTEQMTNAGGGSSRETIVTGAQGVHNRALNISGSTDNRVNTTVTGSSGFIVKTAGDTVLTLNGGGSLTASDLNTKSLYEIGVARVSGSGNVEVLFP